MTTAIGKRSYYGATPDTTELSSDCGSTDLLLDITTISPSSWPATSWGPFMIIIDPDGAEEHVLVSSLSSSQFTVPAGGRGRDGTDAQSHLAGVKIIHGWDGESAQDANDHIQDTTRSDHTQYPLALANVFQNSGGSYDPNPNERTIVTTSATTINLPGAQPVGTQQEIENLVGFPSLVTINASGSDGIDWPGGINVATFTIPQGATARGVVVASAGSTSQWVFMVVCNGQDSGWIAVANGSMSNSWVNGTPAFGYRLIGNQVRLRGQVANGSMGPATVLTLPVGYRPSVAIVTAALAGGPVYNNLISILTSGVVSAYVGTGPTSAGLYFDGITFLVD